MYEKPRVNVKVERGSPTYTLNDIVAISLLLREVAMTKQQILETPTSLIASFKQVMMNLSVFQFFFLPSGHAIFQGGHSQSIVL